MTKTLAKISSRHDVKSGEPGLRPLGAKAGGFFVWSALGGLGHWDLFEIWYLVLGIFMVFVKRLSSQY
jgi:hypothetical protein